MQNDLKNIIHKKMDGIVDHMYQSYLKTYRQAMDEKFR